MSFPSNYAHRGLFIHKSSISEVNLIIPSNVLNFTHCPTNMGGGETLTKYFCRRAAEVRCSMSHTHIKCATMSLACFPWGEKLYSNVLRLHLEQLRHFYRLCPLWDRRTRAGASPGSQSSTQLEQHKWVLGLGEFNFIIRYPNLVQCSKHTVSIDSLSSSPSIQKAVKKLHGQKKKFHPGRYCRSSPCSPPHGRTHQNGPS